MTPTTLMELGIPLRIFTGSSFDDLESVEEDRRYRAKRAAMRLRLANNVILPLLREWKERTGGEYAVNVTWNDAPANVPATLPKSEWIGGNDDR